MTTEPTSRDDAMSRPPLRRDEFDAIFDRAYSINSKGHLAKAWGGSQEHPDQLWGRLSDPARLLQAHQAGEMGRQPLAILYEVARQGGRMRGEQLRKVFLVRTQQDVSTQVRELLLQGWLLVLPEPGQSHLELEDVLEQQSYLSSDLTMVKGVYDALDAISLSGQTEAHPPWQGEIESVQRETVQSLEINTIHMLTSLLYEPLLLNKSGAPNRRSLTKFVDGMTHPAQTQVQDPSLDPSNDEHVDYITFLLAIARELGLTSIHEGALHANFDQLHDHFERADRSAPLLRALQNMKIWSELSSAELAGGQMHQDAVTKQLSQTEDIGTGLIGARGYILSVLRRIKPAQWTPCAHVVDLCVSLDRDYLDRVLKPLSSTVSARDYVRVFLNHALFWGGLIELATDTEGQRVMRLTPEGHIILGQAQIPEPPAAAPKCLVVQPNFEVTLFLDAAPTSLIWNLYRLGQRVHLADRVATFKMTSQSVQRSYSQGMSADQAQALLAEYAVAPLPESVAFQLGDWERSWRRMRIWAGGILLRHEDIDKLDDWVSRIKYAWRQREVSVERISAASVFLYAEDMSGIDALLERDAPISIDYQRPPTPSLTALEPLRFEYSPMHTDFETLFELDQIATVDPEQSTPGGQVVQLQSSALKRRWPQDPFKHAVSFLAPRVKGGLPPVHLLRLKELLGHGVVANRYEEVYLVTILDEEDAALFAQMPQVQDLLLDTIAGVGFVVAKEDQPALDALLELAGIDS